MDKVGGYRNYGYGKQLFYAGKQALLDRYGEGCYSTRHSHTECWRLFANFLKAYGINDTRKVTLETVEQYAVELRDKALDFLDELIKADNTDIQEQDIQILHGLVMEG